MSDKIDILLLQDIKSVGRKGEIKSFAISYAKNVIIAKGWGKIADASVKNQKSQKENHEQKTEAEYIAKFGNMCDDLEINGREMHVKSMPNTNLYQKIDEKYIAKELSQKYDIDINTKQIKISNKISKLGAYEISVFYKDIYKKITLHIK